MTARVIEAARSPMAAWRRRRSGRSSAEAALIGMPIRDARALERGLRGAARGFLRRSTIIAPSARYRIETAHALLGKALIEAAGTASTRTRVIGHREKEAMAPTDDVRATSSPRHGRRATASARARSACRRPPADRPRQRHQACHRRGALYRRHAACRPARCIWRRAMRRSPPAASPRSISSRCARRPASSRC